MFKGCYQGRVPMLKAKIDRKTSKSNHGKVRVSAASQSEFRKKEKFLRGMPPLGRGYRPPKFFHSYEC